MAVRAPVLHHQALAKAVSMERRAHLSGCDFTLADSAHHIDGALMCPNASRQCRHNVVATHWRHACIQNAPRRMRRSKRNQLRLRHMRPPSLRFKRNGFPTCDWLGLSLTDNFAAWLLPSGPRINFIENALNKSTLLPRQPEIFFVCDSCHHVIIPDFQILLHTVSWFTKISFLGLQNFVFLRLSRFTHLSH